MTSVAVISSVHGGFDHPWAPPEQDIACEWVMVTDTPGWPPPWRQVIEPRPQMCPRLASKVVRARPDWYSGADVLITIDGNVVVHNPGFAAWCVRSLGDAQLAQGDGAYLRPGGITQEAAIAASLGKYDGQPVTEQAAWYVAHGHPDTWGNWWSGLIVRRRDCPDFGTPWLAEMMRWGCECQVSEPYVLRRAGVRPAALPDHEFDAMFRLSSHQGES